MADDLTFMLRGLLPAPAWIVHYCNYAGAMKKKRKKYLLSKCLKGWIFFPSLPCSRVEATKSSTATIAITSLQ